MNMRGTVKSEQVPSSEKLETFERQAIFIRHGQSRANIGDWLGPFAEAPLTALGEQQAAALAATWPAAPAMIVVSPYLRARQTAAPTMARFPAVPVETWPIHEYTFWDPIYWGGAPPVEAMEDVAKYWRLADPAERRADSSGDPERTYPDSESFSDLLRRTEETLDRLATLDLPAMKLQGLDAEAGELRSSVLLFTHGHFMQALRHTLQWPQWTHAQKMANFQAYDAEFHVLNTETITVVWDAQRKWRLQAASS
jgi:broad specificity phosphatase PhoE